MKKASFFFAFFLFAGLLFSQELLKEHFNGPAFPPTGWIISNQTANWSASPTFYAGGTPPEARFLPSPAFTGISRIITPALNLTGLTALSIDFKEYIRLADSPTGLIYVGIATRSNQGSWNIVREDTITQSFPGFPKHIVIKNADVGKADFQLCFYFSGKSTDIVYYFLDDFILTGMPAHDVKPQNFFNSQYTESNQVFFPQALIRNTGVNPESFDVSCEIFDQTGTSLYLNTQNVVALPSDSITTASFTPYITPGGPQTLNMKATTLLSGDMIPENDTLSKPISILPENMLVYEGFDESVMPPGNWTIDDHSANWSVSDTKNAGGAIPECQFSYHPDFNGTSRLISPALSTNGMTGLILRFKQSLNFYKDSVQIGVSTRSHGGAWQNAWSIVVRQSMASQDMELMIMNSDVGQDDFQFCFYFTGSTGNINYWWIDNIALCKSWNNDVETFGFPGLTGFSPSTTYIPSAIIRNIGLNQEPFPVNCTIYDVDGALLYSNDVTVNAISPGALDTVTFAGYTLPVPNTLYKVVVQTMLPSDQDMTNDAGQAFINTYTTIKNLVMLEIGSGNWCNTCPGAAMGANDLIANGKNVGVVDYHYGDTYENPDGLAKCGYYEMMKYPTAIFDGIVEKEGAYPASTMYPEYVPLYESRISTKTPVNLYVTGQRTDSLNYSLVIHTERLAPYVNKKLILQVAVTESKLPEHWQILDTLDFVHRLSIPDNTGVKIDLLNDQTVDVPLSFARDQSWVLNNLELVAWIQDAYTKEILNGVKLPVSSFVMGIEEMNNQFTAMAWPNPFKTGVAISLELTTSNRVQIDIFNTMNQNIVTLFDGLVPAGKKQISWDGFDGNGRTFSNGIYFCRIRAGASQSVIKLILFR